MYLEEDLNKSNLINIHKEVCCNNYFRKEIWTGEHLQITVMSIPAGGEIGLEMHNNLDQFIRVEYGEASVYMGKTKQNLKFIGNANCNYAIVIPAGMWHSINVIEPSVIFEAKDGAYIP